MMSRDNTPGGSRHERRGDREDRRVPFEDLVSDVAAELAAVAIGVSDARIERCLGLIALYYDSDHAFVLLLSSDHSSLSMTHSWESERTRALHTDPLAPRFLALSHVAWVTNRLVPPEATILPFPARTSRQPSESTGRTIDHIEIVVPLRQSGEIIGSLWLVLPTSDLGASHQLLQELETVGALLVPSLLDCRPLVSGASARETAHGHSDRDLAHLYLQVAEVLLVVLDRQGNVLFLNRKGCELLEYSESELLGRNWFTTCLGSTDRDDLFARHQYLLSGSVEGSTYLEHSVFTKQGERRELAISMSLLRDHDGKVVGTLSSGEDITERKRSQAALTASENRYRLMAEQIGQVLYDWDLETGTVSWSGAIEEVTGYLPAELRQVAFADREKMIHPDDRQAAVEALGRAAESDGRYIEAYRFRRKDGSFIYVEDRGTLLRNGHGGPTRMLGTLKDISARIHAVEAIRTSEEKYRSIFESFQDIFYRANMDGQIILVSPSVFHKLGYRPDEVIGHQATEFYADDPSIRQILIQRLMENGSVSDFELRMRTKDGRVLEVSVSAHLLKDANGKIDGYEGVLRDISERKKADAILRSLVKGTAARTGRMFFRALVQSMSEGLGCRYVHVGELISEDGRVRTLAFWNGGKFERNFEYVLDRADCNLKSRRIMCVHARVDSTDMSSHPCFVRSGVKSFIGAPLIGSQDNLMGFLMVMDDQQIPDKVIGQAQSLITIAAARASAELERMHADQVLQRTVAELRLTTEKLKSDQVMLTEKNIALKTILEHIEQEREGYRAEICASLEQALTPFVKKLQEGSGRLSSRDLGALTELVGSIVGQGIDSFKVNYPKLSPRETEICELIIEGHPSKDISEILGISVETIHKHREIIRRKLRIQHLDINLSTYLRSKLR